MLTLRRALLPSCTAGHTLRRDYPRCLLFQGQNIPHGSFCQMSSECLRNRALASSCHPCLSWKLHGHASCSPCCSSRPTLSHSFCRLLRSPARQALPVPVHFPVEGPAKRRLCRKIPP